MTTLQRRTRESRGTTPIGIAALLVLAVVACGKKEEAPEPVVPVQVATVAKGSIQRIVRADAILYPRDQANIMPKISAPVQRFLVNRGDHVRKGQLLAVLENRDLVAAALSSKGQYGQAEANYRSTEAAAIPEQVTKAQTDLQAAREQRDAAKTLLDNRRTLYKEGALARKQVDDAQVAYAQAQAQFETAEQHLQVLQSVSKGEQIKGAAAQLEAAKGQYESAEAQVAYSEIRSPIDGVITDRPLYAGEMANTGSPIVTVMDVSSVIARANLGQDQAKGIHVGDAATLTPADGSAALDGKVTVVSPAVDPNSTTVQVWVTAPNPHERVRAGTSVRVEIVAATLDGVTVIPASAVLPSDEGGTIAMTVDAKNVAHQTKIDVGVREPDKVQVVSGLTPGERVITVGGLGLDDKAKVRVVQPTDKGDDEQDGQKAGGQ